MNSINLLHIWQSFLFKKHLSLLLVRDLIMTGFTSHFREHATVASIPETPNLSFTTVRSSLRCLINRRSLFWQGETQEHLQQMSDRKSEWKWMERQGEPPWEVTAKCQVAVWRSLLGGGEKAWEAWLKAWICGDMSKRRNKGQVGWPILSVWLYCTSGNFITAERMEAKSALIDRLTLTGCDIQGRPLPGQEREQIFKLLAWVLLNFLPCFSSLWCCKF